METTNSQYSLEVVEKNFYGYELYQKIDNGQVSFVAFLRNDVSPVCRAITLDLLKCHVRAIIEYDRRIVEEKNGPTIRV